ncbi:MAG: hypothetical protein ACLQE9_18940 [Roseiarcus sp.]
MGRFSPRRAAILAAALGLGLSAWLVMRLVAPAADPLVASIVAFMPLACCGALAFSLDEKGVEGFVRISLSCAAAALLIAALSRSAEQIALFAGFGSLGLALVGGYRLAKAARWRRILVAPGNWAVLFGLIAFLSLYCLVYVTASRDLMFGDFMYRRIEAIIVASFLDKGQLAALLRLFVNSMKDEYSLLPVLAPGAVLAVSSPPSRAWYQGAVIALYAAPAILALGVLARDLARRAARRRAAAAGQAAILALAVFTVFAAYPTGMAVVARGMPDIGGLVLVVAALRLADRLARLLALPAGQDARIGQLARLITLALALCLFGMFLFRRWYAFAAVGVLAMLMFEAALLVARRRADFRWREAISAAALGGLALLALGAPILIDWLPNPGAHDYVTIYAAYRKEPSVVVAELFDWYGAALLGVAVCCAIFLGLRSGDRRLLRLTCGSTLIAAALFLGVQSPAIHHAYLLAPAFAATIGGAMLMLFERSRIAGLTVAGALAAFTLTPAVSSWAPRGFAPTAGQPPAPRADLAELGRLKAWIDANARPDRRYCVLASSYTINDAIVDELWQLDPKGLPLIAGEASKVSVGMAHVDTRDGPPVDNMKDCAIMLVGDPVQTHLVLAYQQTVIVPASEMLAGVGIGANYRRTGEVFRLEKGVKLVVFERIHPLDGDDVAALQARWRAARIAVASGLRGASSD